MPRSSWVARPMSTTMSSESSSSLAKVASTTNVAPCKRCAGPNTSPRRLCAIMMWSRTVTLNIGLPFVVGQDVAERGQPAGGQAGHHFGQLVEAGCAAEQRVECRVLEQVQ